MMVEFAVGTGTGTGYLAMPQGGKGPGVLVLHAWWGLTPFFKQVCDRFAREGFVTLAPDLYHGRTATTRAEAEELRDALDGDEADKDITAAIQYLGMQAQGDGIGVVAWSLGSWWALQLEDPAVAIVTFYGLSDPEHVTGKAAFQGHFGELDEFEAVESVRELEQHIRATGREATFFIYPRMPHWFFETDQPEHYNAEAASLAWKRTIEFLHEHLRDYA